MKTTGIALIFIATLASCRDSTEPAPTGAKYVVTFSPSAPSAGDMIVARAQLVDESGATVRLAGRQVKWTSTAGVVSPPVSLTTGDGIAVTRIELSRVAGVSYTIGVADDRGMIGQSGQFTSLTGPAARYVVTTSSTSPQVGSTITATAQLTDLNGNPVATAGRVVTWSTSNYRMPAFSPGTSTTNANGIASGDLAVGTAANVIFVIFATDDQSTVGSSLSIHTTPGAATRYSVYVDSSESNPPAGAPVVVSAQLSDGNGNPVATPGRVVSWSFTGTGASLSAPTTSTDNSGGTNVLLTTSGVVGASYAITATDANGVSGTTAITTQPQMSLSSIATGFESSSVCGTSPAGELWCWGDNGSGELGTGATSTRFLPGRANVSVTLTSVSVGSSFACGLTSAGAAYCWGNNVDGALGDGSQTSRSFAAPVASTLSFQSVTAGDRHACALAATGDAYCWGSNDNGRLGAATGSVVTSPIKVSGGLSFSSLSAGDAHTCGIVKDGTAYCWGLNADGQLGDGSFSSRVAPTAVVGAFFASISAGLGYTCGVASDGAGYCWGSNGSGQLGNGTQFLSMKVPTRVVGGLTLSAIAAGGAHTCALTTAKLAYCWGDDFMGELGDGGQTSSRQPGAVVGGLHFATIGASSGIVSGPCDYYCYYYGTGALSNAHSCGITADGTAYCWGSNLSGQLGRGHSETSSSTPVKVAGQR